MKKLFMSLFLGALLVFTSSCNNFTKEKEEKENVELLLGIRSNSKAPDLRKVEDKIKDALKTEGKLGFVLIDGSPKLVKSIDAPKVDAMLSSGKKNEIIDDQVGEISSFVSDLKPQVAECDILKAINISADNFADKGGRKSLVIMDSGLSTTGLLDFRSADIAKLNVEDIIKALQKKKAIPNLKGVDVIWYGLGQTTSPQVEPSSEYKHVLEELWTAILNEAGAKSVHIAKESLEDLEVDTSDYPPVSPVDCKLEESVIANLSEPLVFDEEEINFIQDSDQLLTSQEEVESKLKPIVDFLRENSDEKILLAGTTAKYGTQEACIDLSYKRCQTIKQIFVEMGLEEERVSLLGLGYENPFYINDLREDGSQDVEIAKKNRSVIVMDLDSDLAKKLLKERG